jgi:O-antigen/teichoic acid export membrane protein
MWSENVPADDVPLTDSGLIRQRALKGIAGLTGRSIIIKVIGLGGGILLARLLSPELFGLYGIAMFVVTPFSLFIELGLAAAFIRKANAITDQELNAFFTFQLFFVGLLCASIFLLAPGLANLLKAPDATIMIRACGVWLFFVSLRSSPNIILERAVNYKPIALAEIYQQFAYWIIATGLALFNTGIWSFAGAVMFSGLVGTLTLYLNTSWRPKLEFNWRPIWQNARFGFMYQSQYITGFLRESILTSLTAFVFSPVAVGHITWARNLAAVPMVISQTVTRVSYSAFSRLQNEESELTALLNTTLKWVVRISLPLYAILGGFSIPIIIYIYDVKWLPSSQSLVWFLLSMSMEVILSVLLPAIYSTGRAKAGFILSIVWAILTWALGLTCLAIKSDPNLIPFAYAIASTVITILALWVLRGLHIQVVRTIIGPFVFCAVYAAGLYWVSTYLVHSLITLIVTAGSSTVIGLGILFWGERYRLLRIIKAIIQGQNPLQAFNATMITKDNHVE